MDTTASKPRTAPKTKPAAPLKSFKAAVAEVHAIRPPLSQNPHAVRDTKEKVLEVAIGREVPGADPPIAFGPSRLLCEIKGYKPEVRWRDLTYGFLLEDGGEYFHFYNAVWRDVLLNRVDPRTLD